jgi:hypothetical protein
LLSIAAVLVLQIVNASAPTMRFSLRPEGFGIESWIRIVLLSSPVLFVVELDKFT